MGCCYDLQGQSEWYANELLINYLLNFPSQGGRGLEHCSTAPHPVSSCLPSIKASLPGDWFRRLVAPQANAKVIYLSWGVYMRPGGNISHCLPKWDTTSKQRHMGGAYVIIWHMLNGSLRMIYPVLALSMNLESLKVHCIPLHPSGHTVDWWSTML